MVIFHHKGGREDEFVVTSFRRSCTLTLTLCYKLPISSPKNSLDTPLILTNGIWHDGHHGATPTVPALLCNNQIIILDIHFS